MSGALTICCCTDEPDVIPGECCGSTWFQNQPDSLSFSSGNQVSSTWYAWYVGCNPPGPDPLERQRWFYYTRRRTVSYSSVELEKYGTNWGFYNGTISSAEIGMGKDYSLGNNCPTSVTPTSECNYTVTSSVTAVNGVYTTSSSISCSSSSGATTTWAAEPSGIADRWFELEWSCGSNGVYCKPGGSPVELENIQFRIGNPFPWPASSGCTDCPPSIGGGYPGLVANNPDCDTTDVTGLDWYNFPDQPQLYWCTNTGGDTCQQSTCDCGYYKDEDVYDTSEPPRLAAGSGFCYKNGRITPIPSISAI
jgi:hypothetical protein